MLTASPSSMTSLQPHLCSRLNPDSTWCSGPLVIRPQPYPGLSWIIPIGINVFNLVKRKGNNNCGKPDRYLLLTASQGLPGSFSWALWPPPLHSLSPSCVSLSGKGVSQRLPLSCGLWKKREPNRAFRQQHPLYSFLTFETERLGAPA